MSQLPKNSLIQFPTGRWGFVGSVDLDLYWQPPFTAEQVSAGQRFGERFAGLKRRTFATFAEAETAREKVEAAR